MYIGHYTAIKRHMSVLAEERMSRSSPHFLSTDSSFPSWKSLLSLLFSPFCLNLSCFLSFLSYFSFTLISSSIFSSVIIFPSFAALEQHRGLHSGVTPYLLVSYRNRKSPKRRRSWGYKHIIVGGASIVLLMCFAAILFQALVPGRKFCWVEKRRKWEDYTLQNCYDAGGCGLSVFRSMYIYLMLVIYVCL